MSSRIVPLIPKHTVYVEPFAGGAAVFFAKPWPKVANNNHYREVLNDTNSEVTNFFKVLRDRPDELVHVCSCTPYSREEYKISKDDSGDDLERARRFFVSISQSFAHKYKGGWGTSVFTRNNAATWSMHCKNLALCAERLHSVYIENDDALAVIKRWDSPQTLFYCDPPYVGADQGHYSGYTEQDFFALIQALNACKGSFLLSCYGIKNHPKDWQEFNFSARMSAAKAEGTRDKKGEKANSKRTEYIYRRLNTVPVRPEIQKLYDSGAFDCYDQ